MNKQLVVFKRGESWKTAAVVFALFLAMLAPFYFGEKTQAEAEHNFNGLTAVLTGSPIASVTPRGTATYTVGTGTNPPRSLSVDVSSVNLAGGTHLNVLINGTSAGQITLSNLRTGRLFLSTSNGGTVPTVAAGATVAVKNGDATILSGTFTAPASPSPTPTGTGSPSPSPSHSPTVTPTHTPTGTPLPTPSLILFAPLTGSTIDGVSPRGMGQYAEIPTNIKILNVFVNRIRLASGTQLSVFVGTTSVGQITLNNRGEGSLRLNTSNGGTVPTITPDTALTVKNGNTTILSGTFRVPTPPTPTPTPTGSPSPTPTHTPHQSRIFGGRLSGAQVVPTVTTEGRGKITVVLNQAETQISVYTSFRNLSSAQTSATINGPAEMGENAAVIFNLAPAVGGTSGNIPVKTFDVTAAQVEQLRNGLWYAVIGTTNHATGEIRGQIRNFSNHGNFNGGDCDDIAVFRPTAGAWYIQNDNSFDTVTLGGVGDKPVSGDYDGDGNTDAAVFGAGVWTIRRSSDGGLTTRQWGLSTDIPVSGDYDGDGRVDLTVFRPDTGAWYIQRSSDASFVAYQFGANGDKPVPADMDGDGRTDIVVFRQSVGDWYWLSSRDGQFRATHFGANGDVPVSADMDGDGADDLAVFRPSVGDWYWISSSDDRFHAVHFGTNGDVPVAGNFDTDDRTDIAVFRPSSGAWYILRSTDNTMDVRYFGTSGDVPTTAH